MCATGLGSYSHERRELGYSENRNESHKSSGRSSRRKGDFDDATFAHRSVLRYPDHVNIVIHNYRWRLRLAKGESRYDDLERKFFEGPVIAALAITIASDY